MATLRVDGLLLPGFPPLLKDARKRIKEIEDFPTRKEDILLFNYPKSGNHWLNAIIPRLLRNSLDSDHKQTDQMLEFVEDLESLKSMPSPRVMTSHLLSRNLPKDHIAKGGKIVHIIRNPKDVALSAFHHYNQDPHVTEVHGVSKDLSTFLDSFLKGDSVYGSWFDREREWEEFAKKNMENFYVMYYEDLKQNGMESMKKLSTFLGTSTDPKFLQAVYDTCSIEEVKKRLESPFEKIFHRKGIVGDWKSSFTDADNKKFDQIYKEKMKDSKLKIRFS
ncbi:sulfotransferase 1A1-like [Crassostrea angulata]|uniref:sulfotransferase 1A1-like n=1 Tax=Magallana angulata TaxID=2784310 RepID=UPI0022B09DB8|nr:sulfotransferase 1A1-like [Crassostrea angulata]